MTSIFDALRKRFSAPEWAYFEEVRNGTGYARKTARTADGMAFSLWPSRGLELHGIEVKVSRGDWLREKNDPEKAEEIGRFCDRWWLAVVPGVVLDRAEVPPAWGLLEWDGRRWKAHREAAKREDVQPLDRLMLAALLRKASETEGKRLQELAARIAADQSKVELEAAKETAARWQRDCLKAHEESQKARALLHRLEGLTGLRVLPIGGPVPEQLPAEFVEALTAARNVDLEQARREAQRGLQQLRHATVSARLALRRAGVRPAPKPKHGAWS